MLKWNEYKKLSPLRREEYVFKHKDINSNLYSDVIGLFRWWVYGMVVEILLFLTVGLTYIVPDLEKYQGYTAEFLNSTAQIGEFFFYFGGALLVALFVMMVVRQVRFNQWKKKYVKKVRK